MWYGSVWTEGEMTRLRGGGACGVGHDGILRIFTLGGAGAYGILGGGGSVGTLGSGGAVGTLGIGVAVGTGNLGCGSGRPDQRVIGGMVGIAGSGTGRANCIILDNCISACVFSMPNCAVDEAGCGCWRVAMSLWIECVMFSCG